MRRFVKMSIILLGLWTTTPAQTRTRPATKLNPADRIFNPLTPDKRKTRRQPTVKRTCGRCGRELKSRDDLHSQDPSPAFLGISRSMVRSVAHANHRSSCDADPETENQHPGIRKVWCF
jgi:hypothetical protein